MVVDAANEELVDYEVRFGFRRVPAMGLRLSQPTASLEGGAEILGARDIAGSRGPLNRNPQPSLARMSATTAAFSESNDCCAIAFAESSSSGKSIPP